MAEISQADIRAAIEAVTGAPTSGVIAEAMPGMVRALDELINGKPVIEQRVVKAQETRKQDN